MNYFQEAMERASNSSLLFLTNNPTVTAGIPGLQALMTSIQTTNGLIVTTRVQQEADKSGNMKIKRQHRSALVFIGMDTCSRVVALAINNNNAALQALVDYKESDFKRSTDVKLLSICQVIRDNANANLTALAPYGVTAAVVTNLQTAINNFSSVIPKVRVDKTGSSEITKQLAGYFKTLKATWKKVDMLVEMVRLSNPAFYSEYQKVRKVVKRGSTATSLKFKTVNAQTGVAEPNVTLAIVPVTSGQKTMALNSKAIILKKSSQKGNGFLRNLPDGNYDVTASKFGFQESTVSVSVVNGEATTLTIQLQAEKEFGRA